MKTRAPGFRNELLILYYAVRHRSVPLLPKLVAGLSILYLLSPVDIIPDFIPFAGWLDDLVIVPLLLHLSYRLLPTEVVRESRLRALNQERWILRLGLAALIFFILIMSAGYWYIHRRQ